MASAEDLRARLDRLDDKVATTPKGGSLMDLLVHGATLGWSDEVGALGSATGAKIGEMIHGKKRDFGEVYDESLTKARSDRESYRERHPALGTGAEIVGGLGSTGPAKVASKLPGWLQAIGIGSGFGGAMGAGTAEGDVGDRLEGAASGGGLGAATGGLGYPLVRGVTAGTKALTRAVRSRTSPEKTAVNKVEQAIARDELTPQRVGARLENLGPQATLADAGGANVRALGKTATTGPGPARNRAEMTLNTRAQGENSRITESLRRGLEPDDFYVAEEGFLNNLRTNAKAVYQDAYKMTDLRSDKLNTLLDRDIGKRAMSEAKKLADIEGRKIDFPEGSISTESVDDIKRALDVMIDRQSNPLTGKVDRKGRLIVSYKKQILEVVDDLNPLYKTARKQYAGDAEVLNALRDGRNALKADPESIRKHLADLSVAGQESYRTGAARAIEDVVNKTPDTTSAATRIFGNSLNRKRFRAIFPDEKSFNEFRRSLVSEQRFTQTRRAVQGGSDTASRLADKQDVMTQLGRSAGAVTGARLFDPALVMAGIGRKVGGAAMGKPAAMEAELSSMMFSRDPAKNQKLLADLVKRMGKREVTEAQSALLGKALMKAVGQQEGRVVD